MWSKSRGVRSWGARGCGQRIPGSREGAPSEACLAGASRALRRLCAPLAPGQRGAVCSRVAVAERLRDGCRQPAGVPGTPQDLTPMRGPCAFPTTPPGPCGTRSSHPEPPAAIGVVLPLVTKRSRHSWWGLSTSSDTLLTAVGVVPQEAASLLAGWGYQGRGGTQGVAARLFYT